jgi:hypothetical protein
VGGGVVNPPPPPTDYCDNTLTPRLDRVNKMKPCLHIGCFLHAFEPGRLAKGAASNPHIIQRTPPVLPPPPRLPPPPPPGPLATNPTAQNDCEYIDILLLLYCRSSYSSAYISCCTFVHTVIGILNFVT